MLVGGRLAFLVGLNKYFRLVCLGLEGCSGRPTWICGWGAVAFISCSAKLNSIALGRPDVVHEPHIHYLLASILPSAPASLLVAL
jgi:hypothetical protein